VSIESLELYRALQKARFRTFVATFVVNMNLLERMRHPAQS